MNILPPGVRATIVLMRASGVGVREIADLLGCNVETVARTVGYNSRDRVTLREIFDRLTEALVAADVLGLPGVNDAWLDLSIQLMGTCPLHPEAAGDGQAEALWEGGYCLRCKSEGLERHHARHKAAGTPIVPPWQREPRRLRDETGYVADVAAPKPLKKVAG